MEYYVKFYCIACEEYIGVECPICRKGDKIICINDPRDRDAFRIDTFGFKCRRHGCSDNVIVHNVDTPCDVCGHPKGDVWRVVPYK